MYLKIWDVGGQLTLRRLWQSYYSSCHAIIFVVDSSDVGEDADVERLGGRSRRSGSNAELSTDIDGDDDSGDIGGGSGGGSVNKSSSAITEPISSIDARSKFGRLDECREVLESVLQHAEAVGVPILVLANKQDREDCVEVVRIKEGLVRKVFEGEEGGGVRDSRVLPVSALMGSGVREAVEWVRSRVKWNREGRPPVMR